MRWFSIKGIIEEMKKVHWPKAGELARSSFTVILFSGAFAAFFILCDFIAAWFFRTMGIQVSAMAEEKKQWYVVNTYAGHENKVKENLERRIDTMGLQDALFQIVVAEETEIEYKNGKEVEKTYNLFPGYLFVEMIMTDEAWYVVRNTPGVTGFIGSSGGGAKPFPVAEAEIDAILRRLGIKEKRIQVDFKVGDRVKILSGSFNGSEGTVESLDDENQTAKVLLILFGREIPTDISYSDLEKLEF